MPDLKQQIIDARVIAIIRGDFTGSYHAIAEALLAEGVRAIEITMNSTGVVDAIQSLSEAFREDAIIGAGTVIDVEQVRQVADAGGQFIVSPDTNPEVIRATLDAGLESIPGAITPTEVLQAHRAGARLVKLFPATIGGAEYLRQIRAPLNMIDFIPTGGIDEYNVGEYFAAGAVAVGVGSALVKSNFDGSAQAVHELTSRARRIMESVNFALTGQKSV